MRGEKEQKCLEFIKQKIFTNDGKPILHPFTGKSYTEVDDNEFINGQVWFINSECHKNYFGLLEEDRTEIEQILRTAKSNINASEFPDFVFDFGFIEHFQISSSKKTRKGAEHIKEMNHFVSKVNEETENVKKEWKDRAVSDEVLSKHWTMDNPDHSYSFLKKSFIEIWGKHIKSLEKYTGKMEVGIFLIEYSDYALNMFENVYNGWLNGMSQGDMREPEKFCCYRLTRDKILLDFIYQYKDKIKYVIFKYHEGFEIIRLENIPYLIKLIPWEYVIKPMEVKYVSSIYSANGSLDSNLSSRKELT